LIKVLSCTVNVRAARTLIKRLSSNTREILGIY